MSTSWTPAERANPAGVTEVDLEDMVVRTVEGWAVPITNLFDAGGGDVIDPELAARVVAGPTPEGRWIVTDIDEAERPTRGGDPGQQ